MGGDKFYKQFNDRSDSMFPSKSKWALFVCGAFLINLICLLVTVGVIALAVKWLISTT